MKINMKRVISAASAIVVASTVATMPKVNNCSVDANAASNVMLEYLNRGISAINTGNGMLVSWRYLANDDDNAEYRLYRDGTLIYTSEAGKSTCYLDAQGSAASKYRVDTYAGGKLVGSENCNLISDKNYFDIALDPPKAGNGYTYSPNDASVGDIDGDGQYEIFLKWDPSNSQDNSKGGYTGNVYIDCIRLDGTRVWRIDLGKNIRAGAHYTQFYVADFDLDGIAEMTCKTADGTVDGTGKVIGDASKDYRNSSGYVLSGPEYYTLFDGATGAALDTVNYPIERGEVSKKTWGDDYGNRVDRYWGSAAYVDGVHPCVITGRGYYTRMTAACYGVENKKLVKKWTFDTGHNSSALGYGQGNHNSMPADVDGDGRQELVNGAACLDDNGKLLWCTKKGHGDAMHLGDLDPTRPGLELFVCHEEKVSGYGVSFIDAKTGQDIFHIDGDKDTGRCAADNVWAGNPGAELWGARPANTVLNTQGNAIDMRVPAMNFFSYWDGDLERELLDGGDNKPATITKINEQGRIDTLLTTEGCLTNNSTKGTPCLSADIFGDWREELIVRTDNNKGLRIYCTPYDTDYRITTLMHDAQYRMQVSSQNTAYNQPPHTSFFLGTGYDLPARPTDSVNGSAAIPSKAGAVIDTQYTYKIKNKNSGLYLEVADSKAENGANVQQGNSGATGWNFEQAAEAGYYYIYSEVGDGKTYLLDLDYGKADNGTNIGIYSNTNSDAQLFKLVDNGDGTYSICTKVTNDGSCIGITAAATEDGANAIEWECNGSADQSWTLEVKLPEISGTLIDGLSVKDVKNYQNWKIDSSAEIGDLVFGDRDVTYTELPDELIGAELIQTACDSKYYEEDLAEFKATKDSVVYVAIDTRVESSKGEIPAWLNEWEKTDLQAKNSGDVTFDVYSKNVKAGESVTLGTNSTGYNTVNYGVFIQEDKPVVTTTEATTTTVTTTETTTVESEIPETTTASSGDIDSSKLLAGDANCDGNVNMADATFIVQHVGNKDKYKLSAEGEINADCDGKKGITGTDALSIQKYVAGILTSLPEYVSLPE